MGDDPNPYRGIDTNHDRDRLARGYAELMDSLARYAIDPVVIAEKAQELVAIAEEIGDKYTEIARR